MTRPHARGAAPAARASTLDAACRRILLARLDRLRRGRIRVREGARTFEPGAPDAGPPAAEIVVHDPRVWRRAVLGGNVGAAEAYMDGLWTSPDLVAVVRLLLSDIGVSDRMGRGPARLVGAARRLAHALRRNTRSGSRRNIHDHYDLGNDFFGLFLDPSLTYSCGIFEQPESTLEEAQEAKLERICRKLGLGPDDHLLEIGTGWGSLALHAAGRHGCRVTTTTVSREQHELASRLVREHGLGDRVRVLLSDYRDLDGTYDKLVSIEMIEAVGSRFFGTFFRRCAELLKPEGQMLLQAITIADQRYERALKDVDFIQRHVFPGSCIPSVTVLLDAATASSDLRLFHLEDITSHYARTLRLWRQRFLERIEDVRALGHPERFLRAWEYYLAYCEGGFAERHIGNVQMLMTRPACRRAPLLPPLAPSAATAPATRHVEVPA